MSRVRNTQSRAQDALTQQQFIDRALDIPWSNTRWKTRLYLSWWSCRKFQRFRQWSGFKNKLWSPFRRFHRSVFNNVPSNKMHACQSLLFRSKRLCKKFRVLRYWSGYRNKLLKPSHRSVFSAPLNKMCVCQSLLLHRCRSLLIAG